MMAAGSVKIAIGPPLFGWPESKIRDAYLALAEEQAVDVLYVGEVVCSKRSLSGVQWQLGLAEELRGSGKEVVLSTLAMPTTEHELQFIRDLVDAAGACNAAIEANDMSSVAIASEQGVAFVAGPHLNVYSHGALQQLRACGARRVVLPLELPARDIPSVIQGDDIELEYFAHGHLPLTFSARCYAARAHGLSKKECRHVCFLHAGGIEMHTLDENDFATINGIQIMSHKPFTAIDHVADLAACGVHILRISPQLTATATAEVVRHFRTVADGLQAGEEALRALAGGRALEDVFCNGYYHGRQGRVWITS